MPLNVGRDEAHAGLDAQRRVTSQNVWKVKYAK